MRKLLQLQTSILDYSVTKYCHRSKTFTGINVCNDQGNWWEERGNVRMTSHWCLAQSRARGWQGGVKTWINQNLTNTGPVTPAPAHLNIQQAYALWSYIDCAALVASNSTSWETTCIAELLHGGNFPYCLKPLDKVLWFMVGSIVAVSALWMFRGIIVPTNCQPTKLSIWTLNCASQALPAFFLHNLYEPRQY